LRIALGDLLGELARDHERDAARRRVRALHAVEVAEARGAAEVPASLCALTVRAIGARWRQFALVAAAVLGLAPSFALAQAAQQHNAPGGPRDRVGKGRAGPVPSIGSHNLVR